MKKELKLLYGVLMIAVLAISTIGATYAYWTASTRSIANEIQTGSTIYSISMQINPLYDGFSVIPMNDTDALKGVANKCKDKYDRGACSAYILNVYDWNEGLDYISGFMDITTNNMQNLSYMMLRVSDTFEEGKCAFIEETNENYCIVREPSSMGEDGLGLSLGDSYDVSGMSSTKFILLIWLSNLKFGQNDIDIGEFNAIVTMQAGNGGQIKGSISSVINVEDGSDNTDDTKEEVTPEEEQSGV